MKIKRILTAFCLLSILCATSFCARADEAVASSVECKIALRIITSPDYIHDHLGEIPDANTMDDNARAEFVAGLFRTSVSKADNAETYCTNTIRDNLSYTGAYHLPRQCVDFLPLLKKSFEDKISYKKDMPNFVQLRMNDAIVDMLVMDETAPDKLVTRCAVGIEVMQVNLDDKHLKEKYPLPVACEALFAEMEKTMILPSQIDTIRRQRVIFAIENKDTPKKLDEICEQISK